MGGVGGELAEGTVSATPPGGADGQRRQSDTPGAGWIRRVATTLAFISFAVFVALNLAFVANRGVCCGDDAFGAVVAKNLAFGSGYSTTLGFARPDYVVERFDAHITTGPPVVLTVSAMVGLLGNRFWVPGAVQVTLWVLLLIATWRVLFAFAPGACRATAAIAFLWVCYAVSRYHLEHWYAMLGEVPAALALLLGLAVWAVNPGSHRRAFVAATLWSMAVLTKLLAVGYAGPCLLAAIVVVFDKRYANDRVRVLVSLAAGFLLPILAFEAWKAVSLGFDGYVLQLRSLGQLIFTYGRKQTGFAATEITDRLSLFSSRFGAPLPVLAAVAAFGGFLAWRSGGAAFKRLYLVLLAGVAVHTGYWLVLSLGVPRYFVMGLVLVSALLSIPYLGLQGRLPVLAYSAALALSLIGAVDRLHYQLLILQYQWSSVSPPIRSNRERVVSFLDARHDRRPFIGQWWASVADLEYLSNGVLNFKGYTAMTVDELSRGVLVITNGGFDNAGDTAFAALVAGCGRPVLAAAPYAVYECGGRQIAR
jgi:hypothetical protein